MIALSDTDSFSHAVAGNKATLIIRDSYGAVRDSFDVVVPFGAYAASGAFVFAEVNGVTPSRRCNRSASWRER